MFNAFFAPLDQHCDSGFGATAEAFKEAADMLARRRNPKQVANAHLPINFLYRHAIELYLKSLIIIVHRCLKLPYGAKPYNSEPQIQVHGKWKTLYSIHSVSDLFCYFTNIVTGNKVVLRNISRSDWSRLPVKLQNWIHEIESMDATSTFFRYPITRNRNADIKKSAFKRASAIDIQKAAERAAKTGKDWVKALIVVNDRDEIVEAFQLDHAPLQSLGKTLKACSELLSTIHFGMRVELANGW